MSDTPNETLSITPAAIQWIKALLSGQYTQGTYRLGTVMPSGETNYCCLGVAAAVCFPDRITWETFNFDGDGEEHLYGQQGTRIRVAAPYVSSTDVLPDRVWKMLIGDSDTGENNWDGYQSIIADANDAGGSFEDIVNDYILPMFGLTRQQFEEQYGPVSQ